MSEENQSSDEVEEEKTWFKKHPIISAVLVVWVVIATIKYLAVGLG
jgi:hypothetical protein